MRRRVPPRSPRCAQPPSRLALKVDADGNAGIDFLDGDGKVVQRIAPAK